MNQFTSDPKAIKLVVHIGAAKCGSTSIQYLLSLNRQHFAEQGIVVPDEQLGESGVFSGNQIAYLQSFDGRLDAGGKEVAERLRGIAEAPRSHQLRQIVISAENLCNPFGFEQLFAEAAKDFDLHIIVYVRRQDDYIASAWQQWFVKEYPDFLTFALQQAGKFGNWRSAIEPWSRHFGEDRITVRLFQKENFRDGSLLADFAHAALIDISGADTRFPSINQSYSNAVTEIASALRDVFSLNIHDNRLYDMFYHGAGSPALKQPGEHMLTPSQRMALLEHYQDSNEWVRDTFFANSDFPPQLFCIADLKRSPQLQVQPSSDPLHLLARVLFKQHCDIEKIQNELLTRK